MENEFIEPPLIVMGIFDFFKKKKEPKIDDLVGSIMKQAFPNGKKQMQAIASSLYRELRGKYPQELLMKSIAYCGSLLITAQDKSEQRIVNMGLLLKPENKYTRDEAVCIYKAVVKSYFETNIGIGGKEAFDAFYLSLGNVSDSVEIVNNRIKGSFGDYGISLTNPVPIKGVQSSYTFLNNLLTNSGEAIRYKRLGSFRSSIISELVDGYAITSNSGRSLGTIYICGYCNVENPEPPKGFIIKGMQPKAKISVSKMVNSDKQGSIKPQQLTSSATPRPSSIGINRALVPRTQINPSSMDLLLKKTKKANLSEEMIVIFQKYNICISYCQEIDIIKYYDIFNDYAKWVRNNPLFSNIKENNHTKYIYEQIKHYFKIGIAVYLVNNEYGEHIGRWSDKQYELFYDSLKNNTFTMYYDMLDSIENCSDDFFLFDKCFLSIAEQFYREYKEECIKEIESICRHAYYSGFKYSLVKFGDEFLRQGLTEKDYGLFKFSQNICNALSYGFRNNFLSKEEFFFEETLASQYREVAEKVYRFFINDLLDEKKYFSAINDCVSASIYIGIEAVLKSLRLNISESLTDERIKKMSNYKDFIAKYPELNKCGLIEFQCQITNGSNVLNIKDNSLKEVKVIDLCADSFLLGINIALQSGVI